MLICFVMVVCILVSVYAQEPKVNVPSYAWKPAEYADGTRVNQEFAFTFGNMESCVVNLLNIYEAPIGELLEN